MCGDEEEKKLADSVHLDALGDGLSVRLLLSGARAEWLLLNGYVRQREGRSALSHKFPPSRICRRREGEREEEVKSP